MIYGEVVWRSNNFKDIEFLKHEALEPNLFLPKEDDYESPLFLNKDNKRIKYSIILKIFKELYEFGWKPKYEGKNIIALQLLILIPPPF